MDTKSKKLTGAQLVRSMLLFFGAFLFAFVLNSYIIHEAGHAFGGVLFGCTFEKFHINPFGSGGWSSHCPNPVTMTMTGRFLQGMGGPIFGLPFSIAVTLLLWRKRSPMLLPLLMSASVVCIANFIGVLDSMLNYPGHIFDYGWVLSIGAPPIIPWAIGIASLVFGILMMNLLVPLAGVGPTEPFWKVLVLHLSTWPIYLLIRHIYQSRLGANSSGTISFLVLGLILAVLTAITFKPSIKLASKFTHTEPVLPSASAVWLAVGLGMGLTVVLAVSYPIWFSR